MNQPVKLLIVEDSEDDAKLALRALRGGRFDPTYRRVQTAADLEAALAGERWDAVISDFTMPGFTGMDALNIFRTAGLDIPFILVSGTIGEEAAVEAMKAGASDYVMKNSLARLAPTLERELKETQMRAAHRRTQQALTESEKRFRQLAENIRDVFFLRDVDGDRMLYVSPAYEEIWGRSCESLYADPKSWLAAIHPDDRASACERNRKGMLAGKFAFEYRIVRPDGSLRWIESRGYPVRDDTGRIVRITGIAKDITDRKRSEEELLGFRGAMDATADGILFVNRTTMRFVEANATACAMLGYTREELLQMGPAQLASATPEQVEHVHDAVIAGHVGNELAETQLRRKDGSRLQAEVHRHAIRSGADWIVVGVVRDITERKQAEQKLIESEARFRGLVEQSLAGIYIIQDGKLAYGNSRFAEIFGYDSVGEMIGLDALSVVHEKDRGMAAEELRQLMEGEVASNSLEFTGLRKDGSIVDIGLHGVRAMQGGRPATIGLLQDISGRKRAEDKIKRLNRVYAVLSGINTLIVRVRDRDELFREACGVAVEHGRFKMAWIGVVDRDAMKIVPVASAGGQAEFLMLNQERLTLREDSPLGSTWSARAVREKKAFVANKIEEGETTIFSASERVERGLLSMAFLPLLVAEQAVGVLALYADETEFFDDEEMALLTELAGDIAFAIDHIDKQERLDYLAYYDALTGLANRSLFLERVAQYMRSAASGGHKLAVCLIDLERFKNINDSLGRAAGDALLRQVAEWLKRNLGGADLLARVDADHFAVVVPEVRAEGDLARLFAKVSQAFLDHPFRLNDSVFRIAAKAGIALFPDDGTDTDTLFRNAEAALKKAKASGDRYLFYAEQMTDTVAVKLTLENQLRQALDKEEFVLHYQPKVNLVSGKVTSAEALIRWNDPRTGLVPPGRFIPVLEETGLIYQVGRWALRNAIEQYLHWRRTGLAAVRIAVNVSPLQLRNRGFIAEIEQVIGVDAQAAAGLELEITESVIMADVELNIATLQAVRAMGVTIAIDDFGTGFSSLSYLAKLPVDTLKIDRSFVIGMTASPEGLALVSTIITLAHSLNLKVVAEGVETEEQSRLLLLLNCDEMQGFLFSKPVPSEVFEATFLARPSGG